MTSLLPRPHPTGSVHRSLCALQGSRSFAMRHKPLIASVHHARQGQSILTQTPRRLALAVSLVMCPRAVQDYVHRISAVQVLSHNMTCCSLRFFYLFSSSDFGFSCSSGQMDHDSNPATPCVSCEAMVSFSPTPGSMCTLVKNCSAGHFQTSNEISLLFSSQFLNPILSASVPPPCFYRRGGACEAHVVCRQVLCRLCRWIFFQVPSWKHRAMHCCQHMSNSIRV